MVGSVSLEQFEALFDAAPLGIVAVEPDGRIMRVNPALEHMFGYPPGMLIGQPVEVLIPEGLRHRHQGHRQGFMRSPHTRAMGLGLDLQGRRRDGQAFTVEVSLTHLTLDGRDSSVAYVADVSERVRLAQERDRLLDSERQTADARAQLAAIVDSTDDAILGATLDGVILTWNAAAERLYGYSAAEIIGQPRVLIVPDDRREELERVGAVVARGQSVAHVETIRRHKDGHRIDVSLTFSPIIDAVGALIGISTIARDIGERRRAEQLFQRQTTLARLPQVVAVAANQAASVSEALQTAINAICAGIGWPIGHVYLADEGAGEPLVSTTIWHLDEPERFRAFRAITESLHASTADDLPKRVMLSGQPEWINDIEESPARPRFGLISDLGVRCGFAFPVLVGAEVVAVLEFFAAEAQTPEAALIEAMANVGVQLGRVIERDRAEQALRQSEQMYRTLARNLPNGSVLLFDRQLRFTIADGSALAAAGLSRQMLEGRMLHEAFPPATVAQLEPLYRAALDGVRSELEIESGDHIYLSYFLPVQDESGAILAGMTMSYDITALKRVERELREERELLSRRVAERTADLSLANAELARAARLKDEFLANMSHELRTPLNSILGRAEALQEEIYGPVTPKQGESLRGIEESGRHLLTLINDILDLSKIEAGRLELEIALIDVGLICHTSLRMVTQLALMQRVSINSTLDNTIETIQADERRLKQILVNLLSNAVKFTPSGGRVGLEVTGDVEQQTVTFTVWDTGIGIAAEHLAKLFQPFVQIDSSLSRQYTGTGLGLALVLRLAEAHGGSVAVESTPGQGSRFSVMLPWDQELRKPIAHADDPDPVTVALSLRHVLVVEDSATVAGQLARYLRELGAQVESHTQGSRAVERAVALQPDVIILDVLLPDQSGWEVLRALKAEPRTQAIPVVVVSVVDDPALADELGAAAFLLKPISRTALVEKLQLVARGQPAAPAQPAPPAAPTVGQRRVLIAEDNQANIDVLQDYLRGKGYAVTVARNGGEALAAAVEEQADIILMDIQMPGMDGLEATRRLRAHAETRDVPIIALTALAMPGDRERCLEAGATDYLAKPLNLRSVLAVIEARLGHTPQARPGLT